MRLIKNKSIVDKSIDVNIFATLIQSSFGIGFIPFASGTFASLFAVLFGLIPGFLDSRIIALILILYIVLYSLTIKKFLARYGKDPAEVVSDEVAGQWFAMLLPVLFTDISGVNIYLFLSVSFLLFRFFDITKITPAKIFDKMNNGFGVLMDDMVAGTYAGISFIIFHKLFVILK